MPYDSTGIEYFSIPDFKFSSGLVKDIKVAFRSYNPKSTKGTVLIPTCYAGRINKTLNFTNASLLEYNVVVVAMLGNGESTSSSNDPDFPGDYSLRYEDCINSQYALIAQHLRITSLEAVIGFSMGGQQAYYWAAIHGTGNDPFVKRVVVICGSAKTSGLNYAFLEGTTSALTASADYDQGRYRQNGITPTQGIRAFARAYAAWVPSAEWFRQELWRNSGAQSLHEWLHPPLGEGSYESRDAEDLIVMARLWQSGNIGDLRYKGDHTKALKDITAKVLLMPCRTDQYFSQEDNELEAYFLQHGKYDPIPSIWGHMAGGGSNPEDVEWMDAKISSFMTI